MRAVTKVPFAGLAVALLAALGGCPHRKSEPEKAAGRAPAEQPPAAEAPAADGSGAERASREGESCASTRDCAEPLRCVEVTCRRVLKSRLAEYWTAAGDAAHDRHDERAATELYEKAAKELETDKETPPGHLMCALGRELGSTAIATRDKALLERAARVLHRCTISAPTGTPERESALRSLFDLEALGFDPAELAKDEVSDVYFTKAPEQPTAQALKLTVTAPEAKPGDKIYAHYLELLRADDTRAKLAACYQPFWAKTHSDAMALAFLFKLHTHEGDEPSEDRALLDIDPAGVTPADSVGLTEARTCAKTALVAAAPDFLKGAVGGHFQQTITLTLAP